MNALSVCAMSLKKCLGNIQCIYLDHILCISWFPSSLVNTSKYVGRGGTLH